MNINISIPDEIQDYIQEQIEIGAYPSASEYFLALVRQDKKQKAQEKLETMLLEGLDSEGQEVTPEFWQQLRSSVLGNIASET
jgi:antitoxin ParD1/3/4